MEKHAEQDLQSEILIYTGMFTKLFHSVGLGVPYYTKITRRLKDMDCIRQLVRGGGGQPSKWLMLREPTLELFEQFPEGSSNKYGRKRPETIQKQTVKDLETRVKDLESGIKNLEAVVYAK